MPHLLSPNYITIRRQQTCALVGLFGIAMTTMFTSGCGGSSADQRPKVADPVADFEWGMERLERALRLFRPGSADGLSVTQRKLDYELFPPDGTHPSYTARVTIVTQVAYLHGKLLANKEEKPKIQEEKQEIDDPLEDKTDEIHRLLEFPEAGPRAPAAAAPRVETRSTDSIASFELAYAEGHWRLTQAPEKKHEASWFEYAFQEN